MVYLGDFGRTQTLRFAFTTVDKTTPGLPITYAGGEVSVQPMPIPGGPSFPDGVSLQIDYYGTGCHLVTVDLSAAQYTHFGDGVDYVILAAAGTVDGVDITGYTLAQFSIRNRLDAAGIRAAVGLASASLDVQLGNISAKTDNLPEGVRKAQPFAHFDFFLALSSDGRSGGEGKVVTAERRRDGGVWEPCSNAVAEVELGLYTIDLDAADTDADALTLRFSADGCDPTLVTIKTSLT